MRRELPHFRKNSEKRDNPALLRVAGLDMPQTELNRIAYLFGAGATNAELSNIGVDVDESGLLICDVTKRVIIEAKKDPNILRPNRMFLDRVSDSSNIELFISLVEDNVSDIIDASDTVDLLKEMVEKDIKAILTPARLSDF